MEKELLNILDTAVKIGFGAIISGFATYKITRLNQLNDAKKELLNRKLDTIESAADHINEYLNSFRDFILVIEGVVNKYPNKRDLDLDQKQDNSLYELIRENDESYCVSISHKEKSASKLYLLGLTEASDLLHEANKLDQEVRDMIIFHKLLPTREILDQWKKTLSDIKTSFFFEIRQHYRI